MSKKKKIKIPYGLKNEQIVHISQVESGLACQCVCLVCGEKLVAHKGVDRIDHFVHYSSKNCSPESILHLLSKIELYKKYKYYIYHKNTYHLLRALQNCNQEKMKSWLRKSAVIEMECDFKIAKPDLTILDAERRAVAFIEIVVTHNPSENVVNFCNEYKIPIIQYNVANFDDYEKIRNETLTPICVNCKIENRCPKCKEYMHERELYVMETKCLKCKESVNISFAKNYTYITPHRFTLKEIELSENHGVLLQKKFIKEYEITCLVPTCRKCGTHLGNNYIKRFIGSITPINTYESGLYCNSCNFWQEESENVV